eukprot:Rmarinus@m.8455
MVPEEADSIASVESPDRVRTLFIIASSSVLVVVLVKLAIMIRRNLKKNEFEEQGKLKLVKSYANRFRKHYNHIDDMVINSVSKFRSNSVISTVKQPLVDLRRALRVRKYYNHVMKHQVPGDGLTSLHAPIEVPMRPTARPDGTFRSSRHMSMPSFLDPQECKAGVEVDRIATFLLQSHEIFDLLDEPALEEFCREFEVLDLAEGEFLPDQESGINRVLFLLSGHLEICEDVDANKILRQIEPNDMITSLSDLLVVTVGESLPSCVLVKALEPSSILSLRVPKSFLEVHPVPAARMLQFILIRLTRVTLATLYKYLSVAEELRHDLVANISASTKRLSGKGIPRSVSSALRDHVSLMVAEVLGVPVTSLPPVDILDRERGGFNDEHLQVCTVPTNMSILDISSEPSMYIVYSGSLQVLVPEQDLDKAGEYRLLYDVGPQASIGRLSLITDTWQEWYGNRTDAFSADLIPPRIVRASVDTRVVRISRGLFDNLLRNHPKICISVARSQAVRMNDLVRRYDYAQQCVNIRSGDVLVEQGDKCRNLFVVLHGRLRSTKGTTVVEEFGSGMIVGETVALVQGNYPCTVRAIRDTELACIPVPVLWMLAERYPSVLLRITQVLSRRLLRQMEVVEASQPQYVDETVTGLPQVRPWNTTGPTGSRPQSVVVTLLPISLNVPLDHFLWTLEYCLAGLRTTRVIDKACVMREVGETALGQYHVSSQLSMWLSQQEETHGVVLYVADWEPTTWTKLCIRQADVVLLVGNAADNPQVFPRSVEDEVGYGHTNAQKELVLLHVNPRPEYRPRGTRYWIENRSHLGINRHHHVRVHLQNREYDLKHYRSDFRRLARWLTGTSVGLVLGGGGARGLAHLGVLQALDEMQIPVDMVGGTSIGSFMGGVFAMIDDHLSIRVPLKLFCLEMSSIWAKLKDLTFPVTSYFTGYRFNKSIVAVIGDTKIEDLWLPYFCITTDLTTSRERVHHNGSLWRYIRASMTLAGYLPPICDSSGSDAGNVHYLVDGGYINNLPADIMRNNFGAHTVIAVDVGGAGAFEGTGFLDFGDTLDGIWAFAQRFNPWAKPVKIPSMTDISSQLAYVSSVKQLQEAKTKYCDLYLRPPVVNFGTLEFHRYQLIAGIGYDYASNAIKEWKEQLLTKQDTRCDSYVSTPQVPFSRNRSHSLDRTSPPNSSGPTRKATWTPPVDVVSGTAIALPSSTAYRDRSRTSSISRKPSLPMIHDAGVEARLPASASVVDFASLHDWDSPDPTASGLRAMYRDTPQVDQSTRSEWRPVYDDVAVSPIRRRNSLLSMSPHCVTGKDAPPEMWDRSSTDSTRSPDDRKLVKSPPPVPAGLFTRISQDATPQGSPDLGFHSAVESSPSMPARPMSLSTGRLSPGVNSQARTSPSQERGFRPLSPSSIPTTSFDELREELAETTDKKKKRSSRKRKAKSSRSPSMQNLQSIVD